MRWRKLGCLYVPRRLHPKLATHAANPLALHVEGNVYRLYYSGRDDDNRSSVGCLDLDMQALRVDYVHEEPAFAHGPEGSFYSHGVSVGGWYAAGGARYIGFMGWRRAAGEHWRGEIGRLRVQRDELVIDPPDPFVGLDAADPVSLSYPWVVPVEGGYHMWYGSTITWDAGNGEMLHVLRHAWSQDGRAFVKDDWNVPFSIGRAQAFSRPTVLRDAQGGFHLWFSYRGGGGERYRIGYGFSEDARQWQLDFERNGVEPAATGWDANMVEYPFVFVHDGGVYMLYNGDGYGATGIGLAVLEDPSFNPAATA